MYVKISSYLAGLKDREKQKPESERRDVPNMTELAAAAGINKVTMSRIANGDVGLTFRVGTAILDELHKRGFDTAGVSDLIGYVPPEERNGGD